MIFKSLKIRVQFGRKSAILVKSKVEFWNRDKVTVTARSCWNQLRVAGTVGTVTPPDQLFSVDQLC